MAGRNATHLTSVSEDVNRSQISLMSSEALALGVGRCILHCTFLMCGLYPEAKRRDNIPFGSIKHRRWHIRRGFHPKKQMARQSRFSEGFGIAKPNTSMQLSLSPIFSSPPPSTICWCINHVQSESYFFLDSDISHAHQSYA